MKYRVLLLSFISSLVLSSQGLAQDAVNINDWKLSAELGFVSTSGNTETETLNAKATASTETEKWRHNGNIGILKSSDRSQTTARKLNISGQSDYQLEKPSYLFLSIAYEDDKFSGYDYRISESIGYGRRVIDESDLFLDLEIGPGARQSKLTSGASSNEVFIRGAAKLDWKLSKTSNLTETFTVDIGEDTTITKSVTGLSSQIDGNLSMKFTYTYQNTSDVPPGIDKTDTETAVTLVYVF